MEIAYNHLDLPKNIFTGSDILVNYSYLANGAKLGALAPSGSGLVYIGPMVYFRDITGNLSFESTAVAAGRMTAAGLQYQLRDHLGSTVAVVTPAGASVEASNFAAFGERSSTPEEVILVSSSNQTDPVHLRHHFTGKEDQAMFGTGMPYIDFGARHYSAPLRRWLTPDPLSEKYYDTTPYAYCANNPVNFVDPEGTSVGDYYTYLGNFVASDGIDDGKLYLVDDLTITNYLKINPQENNTEAKNDILNTGAFEIDGLILVTRDNVSKTETMGTFEALGDNNVNGYTLEPPGPSTTVANQNKSIPKGYYNTKKRAEGPISGVFAFRIYSSTVSLARGILGHVGTNSGNTVGCILFGKDREEKTIKRSRYTMELLEKYFKDKSTVVLIVK